jgi:hypothetical protein
MKKLLLGLGTVSLAILPVAAMVSCSTPATALDTEASKFEGTTTAKVTTVTAQSVADEFTAAKDEVTKDAILLANSTSTPVKASEGFTSMIKSMTVNAETNTTLDVVFTITEVPVTEETPAAEPTTKDATFTITGFAAPAEATLETEAAKFTTAVTLLTAGTSTEAATAIVTDKAILETFYKAPTLANGFDFTITSVDGTTADTVLTVVISVTDGKKAAKEVTFTVTGFTASTPA